MPVVLAERDPDGERGATAGRVGELDAATVSGGDGVGDGEAEPGPVAVGPSGRGAPGEALEDSVPLGTSASPYPRLSWPTSTWASSCWRECRV